MDDFYYGDTYEDEGYAPPRPTRTAVWYIGQDNGTINGIGE